MTQTNFLVFITDQHHADWLGCCGHPVVKTPTIDSLAQRGVRFSNFNVASPVCMPNRASLFTGRYPSVHGLRYNGCLLPQSANTFVDVLRQAGYATATIGKSHLQPFTDRDATSFKDFEAGMIEEAWKPDALDYGQEAPGRMTPKAYTTFAPLTMALIMWIWSLGTATAQAAIIGSGSESKHRTGAN
ncbi:hypothetical protein C2W62_27520 [Candidatus Entotheonella serta]|nr:hypothetical protein C2W62_27520 [Candidatus Entotheonella serta]